MAPCASYVQRIQATVIVSGRWQVLDITTHHPAITSPIPFVSSPYPSDRSFCTEQESRARTRTDQDERADETAICQRKCGTGDVAYHSARRTSSLMHSLGTFLRSETPRKIIASDRSSNWLALWSWRLSPQLQVILTQIFRLQNLEKLKLRRA